MRYASARAFRDALEERLRVVATTGGVVDSALLSRLRKRLVFERFLARLQHVAPKAWVLKGGFALELRLGDEARTTKDIDVDWFAAQGECTEYVLSAASAELGDFFEFEVERQGLDSEIGVQGQRWKVQVRLDERTFENVSLDIGFGDPVIPAESLPLSETLGFADLAAVEIPALSVEQHLAEKVHAYTRLYGAGRATSRVKDLMDMALVAVALRPRGKELRRGLHRIFDRRATHDLPPTLPAQPREWTRRWGALVGDLPLPRSPDGAHEIAAKMLDPVLRGEVASGAWDPDRSRWTAKLATGR